MQLGGIDKNQALFLQLKNANLISLQVEGLSDLLPNAFAKTFNLQPDEVGILKLEKQSLIFVYPARLHMVGTIPLNTLGSVASRTATSKRAEVINAFAQAKHISVFESVELKAPPGEKSGHTIQKLMSAPVIGPEGTLGVIEVCRKGISAPAAGPDFSPVDLQKLAAIATALAKCFK